MKSENDSNGVGRLAAQVAHLRAEAKRWEERALKAEGELKQIGVILGEPEAEQAAPERNGHFAQAKKWLGGRGKFLRRELGNAVGLDYSNAKLTRVIAELEEGGLIERKHGPGGLKSLVS